MNNRGMRRLNLSENRVVLAAARSITADDHGRCFVLSLAAGFTVTLPASTGSGLRLEFRVGIAITSNSYLIKVQNTTDVMNGQAFSSVAATKVGQVWPAAATDDTITLNGGTTGGVIGDRIDIYDLKAGFWQVTMWVQQAATEATPFSATV